MNPAFHSSGVAVLVAASFFNTASLSLAESEPIPLDQLGAVATEQVNGEGLSVTATTEGARLRCAFQRLEGLPTEFGIDEPPPLRSQAVQQLDHEPKTV